MKRKFLLGIVFCIIVSVAQAQPSIPSIPVKIPKFGKKSNNTQQQSNQQQNNPSVKKNDALPPRGKFNNAEVKTAILKEAASQSIPVSEFYFTYDAWENLTGLGENEGERSREVYGCIRYKNGADCVYAMVEVKQEMVLGKYGDYIINIYNKDTPTKCE